jgi:hypothetical protein
MNLKLTPFRRIAKRLSSENHATEASSLVRSFVETGDERCPIAGIWSRLINADQQTDDPELARPAMLSLLSWRAFISA